MKKIAAFIIAVCLTFALAACSAQSGGGATDNQSPNVSTGSQPDEQKAAAESNDDASGSEEADTPAEAAGGKTLVAYFSCTGNTRGIAEHIVNIIGADIYEIVPEEPYTDADLNYNDSSSRTTIEMNDDTSRPAISGSVESIEDYDVIFIGYPIWWGQAPHIVYTFVESYDFSGKTIVPFCTSGSSGVGSSATNLHSSASDSTVWLDGTRLNSRASQSDIEAWLGGLGLDY